MTHGDKSRMDRSIFSIRESVANAVGKLRSDPPAGRGEAILCRDGYVVGHQFNFDGVRTVWFVDDDEIKIKNDQGEVLRILDLRSGLNRNAA